MSAPFGRREVAVVGVQQVGAYTVLVVADPVGPAPLPGQFYMLAAREGWGGGAGERPFLPRALSVLRAEPAGELQFLLEDVGPGTRRLCESEVGGVLWLCGPLGHGFEHPGVAALLIGGGVGVAPLAILQDTLPSAAVMLGFRGARHAAAAGLLHGAHVTTDDGSVGRRGFVTELLGEALEAGEGPPPSVCACGPEPMLAAVAKLCLARGVPAQLALEAPMACGFGACHGCVVATRSGFKRVCVDGPVFRAEDLAA